MDSEPEPALQKDEDTTRRYRMVWSTRLERYVRANLTDAEFQAYDKRGSID